MVNSFSYCRRISFALVLILLSGISLSAQIITGEITGTVTDQTGATVAGANVSAVCPDTKFTRNVKSGSAGEYRLANMPSCVYKITVTAQGFKTEVRDVPATVAQITKADFPLQLGAQADVVEVEAATLLMDTSPGINNDVDTERIVDLPLNGRDFKSILALTPGVQRIPGGGFLDVSISGQRTTANNYLVDGMYNNDRFYGSEVIGQPGVLGVSASLLSNDAIAEFTVSELPSAEYGVKGGASVNVTLKSGTNDFHGAAYYFGHWSYTDAANPISQTVTPLHNHQYGGIIGGPIVKDRTFFFLNYEAQKNISNVPYTVSVPTMGDVSQANAYFDPTMPPCIVTPNPATTLTVNCFANTNNLPLNTAGLALLKYFPVNPSTTAGGVNQVVSVPNTSSMNSFLVKIDHKLNSKNQLSGRYVFADSLQSAPASGYDIPPPSSVGPAALFNTIAPTRVQMAGGTWTYSMDANRIWDTRFNWTRYSQILDVNNKINPLSLGIDTGPLDPLDYGVPPVYSSATAGNIGGIFGYPLSTRPTQTYDASEHFTWVKGTHTMKMGGNYQRGSTFSLRNRARSSLSVFETDWTTVLTQLMLGRIDEGARSFGNTARNLYQPSLGLYWQDEWKVRPRLTISYGLRWDLNGALGESHNIGSNFFPTRGLVKLGAGLSRLYNLDKKDFGPRAGLSWDIFGNGKTSLRIGYSMTYDVANFSAISAPYSFHGARAGAFTNADLGVFSVTADGAGTPCINASDGNGNFCPTGATSPSSPGGLFEAQGPTTCYDPVTNPSPDFVCIGPVPGSGSTTPIPTYGANPTGAPPFNIFGTIPNLLTPRIHYYQATIQRELFRNSVVTLSYVGSRGDNLLFERSLNNRPLGCWDQNFTNPDTGSHQLTGPPNSATNTSGLNCNRPFDSIFQTNVGGVLKPSFKYIMQLNNDGYQRYNALQATFRQRNWHNINTQYSFTWSNCIDNNSTNRGGATSLPLQAENPYNPNDSRGPCDTDVRVNFNLGGTYTIPKVSALGRFGEGWELGSVFTALTGRPWTPTGRSSDHSGQDQAVSRADCLQKPIYDYSQNTFITNAATAFAAPAGGTLGDCGRNSLRGPGFKQWDANLTKITRITERVKVQFRWEVFNMINHPNFNPTPSSTVVGSGGFATVNITPDALNPGVAQGSPRVMQFGLKLLF
ncbi:MAG TPA: carboxypeptidase regulatory-like domain-containing protein [Candidatus Acidoferrum sp.]|nr:carboxypeptidase regulatory-like domain-containing protein [Candidatus Acidoferrum sp.]